MSDTVQEPNHAETTDQPLPESVLPEAVVRVDIDAAPTDVWQALTTDDGLASWLGDGSSIGSDVGDEIDIHDLVTGQRKRGVLDEVTPGHRLGYTWWPETKPGDATRVAISLEPTHTGTRVTVIESRPLVPTSNVLGAPRAIAMTGCTADWAWRTALLTISCRARTTAMSGRGAHGR